MVQITNAKKKKKWGYFSMKTVKGKRKISSVETQILMELTTMTAQQYDVSNWGFEKFITRHPQLSGTWRWMLNGGQQTLHVTSYWEFSELNTWKVFLVWVFSSGQRLVRRTCFFSVVNISRATLCVDWNKIVGGGRMRSHKLQPQKWLMSKALCY